MLTAAETVSLVTAKAALRAEALARRAALGEAFRSEASASIREAVLALDIAPGTAVSAFLPIRGEVDLAPVLGVLHARGHKVLLPALAGPALVFRCWTPATPLVPLGFGTQGPGPDTAEAIPDVMLMPLAAFDREGGRIGYGRAYYDRTIAAFRALRHVPCLIGIAFSVQEVASVPMEAHDVPLHAIITERGVISAPAIG